MGHNAHLNAQQWLTRKLSLSAVIATNKDKSYMDCRGLLKRVCKMKFQISSMRQQNLPIFTWVTRQLIRAFVFIYAKSRFSDDVAHLSCSCSFL